MHRCGCIRSLRRVAASLLATTLLLGTIAVFGVLASRNAIDLILVRNANQGSRLHRSEVSQPHRNVLRDAQYIDASRFNTNGDDFVLSMLDDSSSIVTSNSDISQMSARELLAKTDYIPSSAEFKSLAGRTLEFNFTIGYMQANPDGFSRRVISVNNVWPPPTIEAQLGDVLVVNVRNELDKPTTLHMHGLFFKGIPFYDGAFGITECGVPPNGGSARYVVPVTQTGTYWYHAHVMGQYVDGFRGPLILKHQSQSNDDIPTDDSVEHSDTIAVDGEHVLAYADWYHRQYDDLYYTDFLNMFNPGGAEPVPESCVVNGYNGQFKTQTFRVKPGKKYRFRLINMSALSSFNFKIDNHDLYVVEVDGVPVSPHKVEVISLAAAQRVSVLLTAKTVAELATQPADTFVIRGQMDKGMFDSIPDGIVVDTNAILEYEFPDRLAPRADENADQQKNLDLESDFNDLDLTPLKVIPVRKADINFTLNVWLSVLNDGMNHAQFNNVSFRLPIVPTIFSEKTLEEPFVSDFRAYGPQTHAVVVKKGTIVQLAINNFDGASHPFHLHGHEFQVLGRFNKYYESISEKELEAIANPVRRDTVVVPAEGSVVIRFEADNVGAWLFHCHIQWHMDSGLAATVVTLPVSTADRDVFNMPSGVVDACKVQGRKMSGNAAGNQGLNMHGLPVVPDLIPGYFTPRAIGALIGTILSALMGSTAVIWYAVEARREMAM